MIGVTFYGPDVDGIYHTHPLTEPCPPYLPFVADYRTNRAWANNEKKERETSSDSLMAAVRVWEEHRKQKGFRVTDKIIP